eukprot:2480707-Amphidinium_carterae.1
MRPAATLPVCAFLHPLKWLKVSWTATTSCFKVKTGSTRLDPSSWVCTADGGPWLLSLSYT